MAKAASQSLFVKRQIAILVIAVIFVAIAVVALVLSSIAGKHQARWITLLHDTDSTATVLDTMVRTRAAGDTVSFYRTVSNVNNLNRQIGFMQSGNPKTAMPPLPSAVGPQLDALLKIWRPLHQDAAQAMHDTAPFDKTLQSINATARKFRVPFNEIAATLGVKATRTEVDQNSLIEALSGDSGKARTTLQASGIAGVAQQQLALLNRIVSSSSNPASSGATTPTARATTLRDRIDTLASLNPQLAHSNNARVAKLAASVGGETSQLKSVADKLLEQGKKLDETLRTTNAMFLFNSPGLEPAVATLALAVQDHGNIINQRLRLAAYVAGGLALLFLIVFAVLFASTQVRLRRQSERRDAAQQEAILRLLDEITNLSSGDLTGTMTVTEDFTGAIADSINYTIETLRELVGTINSTSASVSTAAARTAATARQMSRNSDRQARDIASVATTMAESSQQLEQVSGQAQELAEQANTSVQTAHNGAQTVNQTIDSMSRLRDQIQDTAKRIKRLGESSQEIGNITEVINDIAEQTNTLALNASIQAAMAGESGRGFAVVAGEVQRLAERATTATRRIETLVKTIQTDTNEAIVSMEQSTSNVVSGARSAEDAGQALGHIENSSQQLAHTISAISDATRSQSQAATTIAERMQAIRQIAVDTSTSANQTSTEVGELNTLSDRLRESVAGFTLPADITAVTETEPSTELTAATTTAVSS